MKLHDIEIDEMKLAKFCRENQIHELLIFGSVTETRFGPESDVDMAIEYEPDAQINLFEFAGHELALSEMIGRTVHLTERSTIPIRLRDEILRGAVPAYVV